MLLRLATGYRWMMTTPKNLSLTISGQGIPKMFSNWWSGKYHHAQQSLPKSPNSGNLTKYMNEFVRSKHGGSVSPLAYTIRFFVLRLLRASCPTRGPISSSSVRGGPCGTCTWSWQLCIEFPRPESSTVHLNKTEMLSQSNSHLSSAQCRFVPKG